MRLQLFEFEDQRWFPVMIRDFMMDYLQYMLRLVDFYGTAVSRMMPILEATENQTIVDLCSGGGGAILSVSDRFLGSGKDFHIVLSDKYPNIPAFTRIAEGSEGNISFYPQSLDVLELSKISGPFTMFTALHHFTPEQVKVILSAMVDNRDHFVFFDGGSNRWVSMVMILLVIPLSFLIITPFIKPFRWNRILFTYFIPVVPLCTLWDGIISMLRLYTPRMIESIFETIKCHDYHLEVRKIRNKLGFEVLVVSGGPDQGDYRWGESSYQISAGDK